MKSKRVTSVLGTLSILLSMLFAAAAVAQRASENVQVTVVEVPVTVVDASGNPVRGLTKDSFEVYDEGKRVPVEYFEMLDMKTLDAAQRSTPLPPAAKRNFLLLFDIAHSSVGSIQRAARAAETFIDSQLAPQDLAAVSVFTTEKGARMITSFTGDKEMLRAAIRSLGHPDYFKVMDPLMISYAATASLGNGISASTGEIDSDSGKGAGSSARESAGIDAILAQFGEIQNRATQTADDTEQKNRLRIQLSNMANIARVLDRLHGRKQVILLSEGFDARLVQGREDLSFQATREQNDQVFSGEGYKVDNEQRFGNAAAANVVSDMAEIFRRSDVVLHAIDIKGLRSNVDASAGAKKSSNDSLFLVTKPTGGTVFQNSNDLSTNFARMLEQQSVVYVLGFSAKSTGKPGKFHDLKVKTNQRGVKVSHRAGYYESSGKLTDLEKTISLSELLLSDAPLEDVKVSIAATMLPGPNGKARVPVMVEMQGPKFIEGITANTATANLFLYAFDKQNRVADYLTQRIALDLTKASDVLRQSGIRYYGSLRLPPGEYSVKALVRVEESGRAGMSRQSITVPSFDTATVMPAVFFADAGNWVMLSGASRGDDYPYPFSAGADRYAARANPAIAASAPQKIALFLYNMPLENLGITPTLVAPDGQTLPAKLKLLGRATADERGSTKLIFDFDPAGLQTGSYELRFNIAPKGGSESIVTLPFTVL
ncbi:MAG TPA: VWA domain-containing protein [Thermoanaerobaculia bacterium]|jgi:VWFA-related protein